MKTIQTPSGEVDISSDLLQQYWEGIRRQFGIDNNPLITLQLTHLLEAFMSTSREYIDERIGKKPRKMRLLSAEGESMDRDYYYSERLPKGPFAFYSVQDWVEQHDGEYEALVVQVCNPRGSPLSSQESILVYPREEFSNMEILYSAIDEGLGLFVVRDPNRRYF